MAKKQTENTKSSIEQVLASANEAALQTNTDDKIDIDTSDKEAMKKLCMDELAVLLKKFKGNLAVLPVIREIMDREWGKPGQAVTVTSDVTINVLAQEIRQQSLADVHDLVKRLSPPVTIDN